MVHSPSTARATAQRIGAGFKSMPGMSHWLVGEAGWEAVADLSLLWLAEEALAAAEAGVQEYRNYLDNVPAYYTHNYGSPAGDAALTGWKQIGATDEWFHYVPDPSRLTVSSGGSAGQMLLEVTGRAGAPGAYAYRTMLTSFKLSGILTDSYYSEYALADPNEPGVLPPNVTVTPASGSPTTLPMNQVQVEYTYTNQSGVATTYGPLSLSDAVCKYHTYDENTFIDSLGTVVNNWANGGGSGSCSARDAKTVGSVSSRSSAKKTSMSFS